VPTAIVHDNEKPNEIIPSVPLLYPSIQLPQSPIPSSTLSPDGNAPAARTARSGSVAELMGSFRPPVADDGRRYVIGGLAAPAGAGSFALAA
jgi:hypothetical protein